MTTLKNIYNIAFVIGNGKSRENFDLQKLKKRGLIVGCNRIYTEIEPDIICALDEPMRKEILDLGLSSSFLGSYAEPYYDDYCNRDMVRYDMNYAYINGSIDLSEAIRHYPENPLNSGLLALVITSYLPNINKIYLLGFDFHHPDSEPKASNLYHDNLDIRPKNYADQINTVLNHCNSGVEIIVVNSKNGDSFHNTLNITKVINYEDFECIPQLL